MWIEIICVSKKGRMSIAIIPHHHPKHQIECFLWVSPVVLPAYANPRRVCEISGTEQSWTPCPACQGSQGVRGFVSLAMVSWHGVKMNQAPRNLERAGWDADLSSIASVVLNGFYMILQVLIITLKRSHSTFSIIYMFTGQMEIIWNNISPS